MRAVLITLGLAVAAAATYFLLFPRNSFINIRRPGGGTVTLSRTGISFQPAPDHFATNGFDHIEPYVSRLLVPTNRFKFLHIFTPDGYRGFALTARGGLVEAGLTLEWRKEAQRGGHSLILRLPRRRALARLPRRKWTGSRCHADSGVPHQGEHG